MDWMPPELERMLRTMPELSRAYLVGGCVRDWLLGLPVKDYDIEVFGVALEPLARALSREGRADLVGRSFGVIKFTAQNGDCYDFSIPRRDSKIASGHKGFEIEFDPNLTLEEAAARRDFTINALMYDPRRSQVLDFFGGEDDLRERVLRHNQPGVCRRPVASFARNAICRKTRFARRPQNGPAVRRDQGLLPRTGPRTRARRVVQVGPNAAPSHQRDFGFWLTQNGSATIRFSLRCWARRRNRFGTRRAMSSPTPATLATRWRGRPNG